MKNIAMGALLWRRVVVEYIQCILMVRIERTKFRRLGVEGDPEKCEKVRKVRTVELSGRMHCRWCRRFADGSINIMDRSECRNNASKHWRKVEYVDGSFASELDCAKMQKLEPRYGPCSSSPLY
jgi:hypothetical protein